MATTFSINPVPIQAVKAPWIPDGVRVSMLRTDLVDAHLSGNKYFKLIPNLVLAKAQGHCTLLSFGGPWSNHLHALAAAGQRFGFNTIGLIRGEQPNVLNPCLQDLQAWGMQLHYLPRGRYREICNLEDAGLFGQQFGPCYVIPEGGGNLQGVTGCQKMLPAVLPADLSHVVVACGTGTTFTGLITSTTLPVYGIQAVKGEGYLHTEIQRLLKKYALNPISSDWRMFDGFHRGGFAKADAGLIGKILQFEQINSIALEPVYSGKLLLALEELLVQGMFDAGSHILLVHGGGLQGRRGFPLLDKGLTVAR